MNNKTQFTAAHQYIVLLCQCQKLKTSISNKELQILVDNEHLSHLSLMKPPGSLRVTSSSHWDSLSAATVVTFTQPRCCCHHRLKEVPLCLEHMLPFLSLSLSLCNPFTPFHSYLKTWTDSKHWHTWHGVITTLRSALGLVWLQREEEKVTVMLSCVHSEMPFHSHTYIFMSVYPPGPIVEKEAVSITGRPLWPPWNSCVCLPYLRVCNGSINNGYSLVWS